MLSFVMLINRAGSMVLPFLGVYMTEHLGFGLKATGIVLSFYGVGSLMGSLLGGYLTDKLGAYRVQACSLFVSAPLFLLIPFFTSVEGLAAIIWLQSLISESFRPANSVAITRYSRPESLTQAFSLNRMAVNLGFSVGPALGGILSSISYNLLFLVNAFGVFAAGVMYVYFFRKRQVKTQGNMVASDTGTGVVKGRSPYRDARFLLFTLLCAVFSIFFLQFFNTLPIFYKEVALLDKRSIGYILAYSGLLIVLLEMIMVNMAQRYLTIAQTLLLGTVAVAVSFGLLAVGHHILLLLLSITLLSIGEILVLPFMSTLTVRQATEGRSGAYMGLNGLSFSVSFIITPFLGTSIAYAYGFNNLWLVSFGILLFVSAAFYYLVRKIE